MRLQKCDPMFPFYCLKNIIESLIDNRVDAKPLATGAFKAGSKVWDCWVGSIQDPLVLHMKTCLNLCRFLGFLLVGMLFLLRCVPADATPAGILGMGWGSTLIIVTPPATEELQLLLPTIAPPPWFPLLVGVANNCYNIFYFAHCSKLVTTIPLYFWK